MITSLILCCFVMSANAQIISLDSANEYYNGKFVPDSNMLHHIEFVSLINVLKITEDSLKTNSIKINQNKLLFVMGSSNLSSSQLTKKIVSTNNEFKTVYLSNCLEMLKTQVNYGIINNISIDDMAEYLGILKSEEYKDARNSILIGESQ